MLRAIDREDKAFADAVEKVFKFSGAAGFYAAGH